MLKFVHDNAGVLSLFALAFIVTMPDDPPASLAQVPGWLYRWIVKGCKTFVSFRSPAPPKDPLKLDPPKLP